MGDIPVTCPYDRSHCVLQSRLQFHLTKCRVNFPNLEKAVCPYNSTHLLNKVEIEHHKKVCPDSGVLENFICQVGHSEPVQGRRPVQSFPASEVNDGDDDWDAVNPGGSVLKSVKEAAEKKPILMGLTGASKAVRRDYKFQQRKRYQEMLINADEPAPVVQKAPEPPSSLPKQNPPGSTSGYSKGVELEGSDVNPTNPSLSAQLNNLTIASKAMSPNAWGKPPVVKQSTEPATSPVFNTQAGGTRSSSNPWKTENNSVPRDIYNTSPQSPLGGQSTLSSNPAMGVWGRGNTIGNSSSYSVNSSDFPTLLPVTGRGRKIQP